ncbi:MAG TPA: filamentous hemagglutinin family protein, partial [Chthoniobacteraceae bacterium]|nr:filamentous hemagglutinin family protein [Chthoniobacteraceae bacterium]
DVPTPLDPYSPIPWAPQYSLAGGNVTISAQANIKHQTAAGKADSERQIPTDWLYRRSFVGADGKFGKTQIFGDIASTTWWTDFSNFFEGIGTLGGGNVTLRAGQNVENVDAVVATNARMPGKDAAGKAIAPDASKLLELGGGDLIVRAGQDIDGGVYYVERGRGQLSAGNTIHTNSTRAPTPAVVTGAKITVPQETWLPTTLFVGKGSFDVSARGDITMGPVVNAFLAPPGEQNDYNYRTYFSTYSADSAVNVMSLGGTIDLRESAASGAALVPMLESWMNAVSLFGNTQTAASFEPWIRIGETTVLPFSTALALQPGTLRVTAFSNDINIDGNLTLSPAPTGTLELLAGGAINALRPVGSNVFGTFWSTSRVIVSDADPANVPGVTNPLAGQAFPKLFGAGPGTTQPAIFVPLDALFAESGVTSPALADALEKRALHDRGILHARDAEPLRLYSLGGNIADLTLFSPKSSRVFASRDITDIGFYLQNVADEDVSVVSAGRDIVAYNPNSPFQKVAAAPGNQFLVSGGELPALTGDIQITGPGALEVLAGRNLDLGNGRNKTIPDASDLGIGITSMGNARNPALPLDGANLIVGAGIGGPSDLSDSALQFKDFIKKSLTGDVLDRYLPELEKQRPQLARVQFDMLPSEQQATIALDIFYLILRDSGRAHSAAGTSGSSNFEDGFAAIDSLFGKGKFSGDISLNSRTIKTGFGGNIDMFAPGGGVSLGFDIPAPGDVPPGIITENGGNISIFTDRSVQVGALRIFTLRGGNEIIWSSTGDIAAGSAAKTVKTAPPTRVVIDAQSADVSTDLAGLATGGGIGVLATRGGVPPGDVDLIAPAGVVDAGDAGIRATGNLNIAATRVLNADNIQVGGTSTGVPAAPVVAAPNLGGITAGSSAAASATAAAGDQSAQRREAPPQEEAPSIITVEVLDLGPDPDSLNQ